MINIYFDGGCQPKNPGGHMAWAIVVQETGGDENTGEKWELILHKENWGLAPDWNNSNNVAEFSGLAEALRWAVLNYSAWEDQNGVTIYGDSQLAVNIINGLWNSNAGKRYYSAYLEARELYQALVKLCSQKGKTMQVKWIPRDLNAKSDEMCNEWYTKHGVKITDFSAMKKQKSLNWR